MRSTFPQIRHFNPHFLNLTLSLVVVVCIYARTLITLEVFTADSLGVTEPSLGSLSCSPKLLESGVISFFFFPGRDLQSPKVLYELRIGRGLQPPARTHRHGREF